MMTSTDPVDERDSEIRAIAYRLWEDEGRPEGQDARHWDAAKEIWAETSSEGEAHPATKSAPPSRPDEPARAGIPDGEPILAIENQGIPASLGDQEGVTKAPKRRGKQAGRGVRVG